MRHFMTRENVLVIDDERGVRTALEAILRDEGYAVLSAATGEEGLELLPSASVDAVLLDVWLPGIDGLETLRRLRDRGVDAEVIMISGHGTIETAVKATKLGAFDFVEKPLSLEKTLLVLRNALRQKRLERRTRKLLEQLAADTEIVGQSRVAERLRQDISAAATSEAPVIIRGERGTGRETVARAIHAAGRFSDGSFVAIPCAALDASAAGEAMFGAGGAPSRIALAAGGSLFLADIERLDPELQERIAGAIASRATDQAPVRYLASTRADAAGIREPLRHAMDVIRIEVPPLRERREDIPLLAERFMRNLAREYGRPEKRLAPECLSACVAYAWPGNVRELRNVIERLLVMTPGDTVTLTDLPEAMGGGRRMGEDLYREYASLAEGVEAFERYFVDRALSAEHGDRSAAAARLGIDRKKLDERITALKLG
jgi:two-component system nitrogen regulation response regulator NtrX